MQCDEVWISQKLKVTLSALVDGQAGVDGYGGNAIGQIFPEPMFIQLFYGALTTWYKLLLW